MSNPTIEARMQRKFILMSTDATAITSLRAALPSEWQMIEARSLDEIGGFQDVLLHRFVFLDLDEYEQFDPLDVIREMRMELMLNVPIFCFGGEQDVRNEARMSRADRFFEREQIVEQMKIFCHQYRWGE